MRPHHRLNDLRVTHLILYKLLQTNQIQKYEIHQEKLAMDENKMSVVKKNDYYYEMYLYILSVRYITFIC